MKYWYKVTVYKAHRGSGRKDTAVAYIYANDVVDALRRYRTMPCVKRHITKGVKFPDILPLPQDESIQLEEKMINEDRISLEKAKDTWYYSLDNH